MPNWCTNKLTMTGETKIIKNLVKQVFAKNEFFNLIIPRPNNEDLGDENYWDESENWGTDRDIDVEYQLINADELRTILISEDKQDITTLNIVFYSAWTPPLKVYEELNKCGLSIFAVYWELGCLFCGCYDNGVLSQDTITGYRKDLPSYLLDVEESYEDFPLDEYE